MIEKTQTDLNNYLIKQLPEPTVFLNNKLKVVYASDSWVNVLEFDSPEILGQKITSLLSNISTTLLKDLKNCIKGQKGPSINEAIKTGAKTTIWHEWKNKPWFDENENVIGVIVQTSLIANKPIKTDCPGCMPTISSNNTVKQEIGTWQFDARLNTMIWSEISSKIFEAQHDFEPNIDALIDLHKDGHDKNTISMAFFNAASNGKPWKEKLQILTEKGNAKWIMSTGKPVYENDNYIGLVGTLQDITKQEIARNESKDKELLLRTLIDVLPLRVVINDLDSKRVLVNKYELNFIEHQKEEDVLGKTDFDFYTEDTSINGREEDLMVMGNGIPIIGKEKVLVKKDGSSTQFLISKIPLRGANGEINGLVGISIDISDIKKKEKELTNLINVTSLQNKKLVNFAHIVSHNLRSHAANFSMLLEFLLDEKDDSEKQSLTNMLVKASDNLLETLDNLNAAVVIDSNINLQKKPIKIKHRIDHVLSNLHATMETNNATIINNIDDTTILKAVPSYLDNILMNFFTNAIKYKSPERDPVIELSTQKTEDYTILSISDNGIGLDLKKYGTKLFGMYKTFHDNADAKGIGLYITKNQIEAMNGKITTTSEVGSGTTFNIYFNENN